MSNYSQGHFAEKIARFFLLLKGYRLVAYNYQTKKGSSAGEIDLIVKKRKQLVFVEVKKRKSISLAAYSVLPKQQQRIRNAAQKFLSVNPKYRGYDIRFDAILFADRYKISHIENAF